MFKILLFALILSSFIFAQSNDSLIVVKKSDLPASILQKVEMQQKFETVGKWAGIGKEVGSAMREGLSALTDETNHFANTKVGKFTMFMIAFKIIGYPVIQFFVGSFILLISTGVFIWSYRKNCIRREILESVDKDVKRYKTYMPSMESQLSHVFIYLLFVVASIVIIFVH